MTDTVSTGDGVAESQVEDSRHPGLIDAMNYPLMTALAERRTRRIAQGVSLTAGDLSHTSTNEPHPLSPLEEAILIVSTGVTGFTMHDGPYQKPDGSKEDLGTPFTRLIGRSASSADNSQATTFFMLNDEGTWLIKRLKGREALEVMGDMPPRWQDWSESQWLKAANAVKHKLYDQRLEFPRDFPYYIGWNKQMSNRPGTTLFFPVVDCTRQYINGFLILLSEPTGQKPLFVDDWQPFRPKNMKDWVAWAASRVGLAPPIPYHPIGGVERVRGGWVNPEIVIPLGLGQQMRIDYETHFLMQNLMLVGQALGVGGWIHGAIWPGHIFKRDEAKGWYGLGFRHVKSKTQKRKLRSNWPPLPASVENPVGLDGLLQALCPPYVKSMDEAVDRIVEDKYGSQGVYGDKALFARSYSTQGNAEAYLRNAEHFSKDAIQYCKDICNYIYDTYGRFPAHTDAFYTPGMWIQFSHLELEYYRKFYNPELFRHQAEHEEIWGDH